MFRKYGENSMPVPVLRRNPSLRRKDVLEQANEVIKSKRFPDEALDSQPRKEGRDGFAAVGAGENYFEIGV